MQFYIIIFTILFSITSHAATYSTPKNYTQTQQTQSQITPQLAIKKLQDGNNRFINNDMRQRDFALQVKATSKQGQAPFAVILSCMDSRGSPEILFDQGIGDIFSLRVAGNVINTDMLASLEYAAAVVGVKVIVVMGHSQCGAVESACKNVKLGNITELLQKIQPAVHAINAKQCDMNAVNDMAKQNVINNMKLITAGSLILKDLSDKQTIKIIGAFQDLSTGMISMFGLDGRAI